MAPCLLVTKSSPPRGGSENAFTGERVLQRPTQRHLWATGRPRMRFIALANLGGIFPNRAHTASPLWPDNLIISRGNPDIKKRNILLNLTFRIGKIRSAVQQSCTGCARGAPKKRQWHPADKNFVGLRRGPTGYIPNAAYLCIK